MNNLHVKFSKYAGLRAVILAIMGILTLIFSELLQNDIVYAFAGYVILCGALSIVEVTQGGVQPKTGVDHAGMVLSCLMIVCGILTIGYYRYLVGFLPFFLGIFLMAEGIAYFVAALRTKTKLKPLLTILALIIIAGGMAASIYSFGFGGLQGLSRIIGVLLLLSCAYELAVFLPGRKLNERGAAL